MSVKYHKLLHLVAMVLLSFALSSCNENNSLTNVDVVFKLSNSVGQVKLPSLIQAKVEITPTEGNSNHTNHFLLELSNPLEVTASVSYQTRDGSAVAGEDYVFISGIATIPAGETSTEIGVEIIGDDMPEANETFQLVISNPVGGKFPKGVNEIAATHTIVDDDSLAAAPLIGVHIAETQELTEYQNRMDAANQLGMKVVRVPTDWAHLEPSAGNYNISYINVVKGRIARAQANGQQVVMMLSQSPAWANGGNHPSYPPLPYHSQDFADAMAFLHGALLDPSDSYTIDEPTILAWEVWNEPNVIDFWPTSSVRSGTNVLVDLRAANEYADLLEIVYSHMKGKYPALTILGGSLASGDIEYLQAMFNYWSGEAKFDHLALHPYSKTDEEKGEHFGKTQYPDQCNVSDFLSPPWCYKQGVKNIRQTLDDHGYTNKQIWFTEFGTSSSAEWGYAGSEAEQLEHMRRALNILNEWYANNDSMKIPVAIAYRLQDKGDDLFGLYDSSLNPKPVAKEMQQRIDSQGRLITGFNIVTKPTLLAPATNAKMPNGLVTFQWAAVTGATDYRLWVNHYHNSGDTPGIIKQTYSPAEASCKSGNLCSVTPGTFLEAGAAEWWVTAIFPESQQESDGNFFTLTTSP